jgi:transglutaminase-like putative cysteine protease
MKIVFLLFLSILSVGHVVGQPSGYRSIDQYAANITAATPDSLAYKLVLPFTTDREKARAIFSWITSHIEYDMSRYNRMTTTRQSKPVGRDTTYDDRSLNERIAYSVMKKGRAVCDGYARLFQTLCDFAGLRSVIITGYARSDSDPVTSRFNANHSWNAVFLDSAWHLVDATWASGYVITGSNTFVKSLDETYYLASPDRFARNHYPQNPEWTLLTRPIPPEEFRLSPFKPMGFYKYGIRSFIPATGIVEAMPGDTLRLLLSADPMRLVRMAPSSTPDTVLQITPDNHAFLTKPVIVSTGQLLYTYIVPDTVPEWVNLVYNEDVVLRYRVKGERRAQ